MEHTVHICTILDNLHRKILHLETLAAPVNYMDDTPENNRYFFNIDLNEPLKRFVALNRVSLPDESRSWIISSFDGNTAIVEGNKMWSEHDIIYKTARINFTVMRCPNNSRNLHIQGKYQDKQMRTRLVNKEVEHTLMSEFITNLIRNEAYKDETPN